MSKFLDRFLTAAVYFFLYAPLLVMVFFSFNEGRSTSVFTGFSLRWYENMFQDQTMLQSIYYTVLVAVIATVVSTVVGSAYSTFRVSTGARDASRHSTGLIT